MGSEKLLKEAHPDYIFKVFQIYNLINLRWFKDLLEFVEYIKKNPLEMQSKE